MPLQVKEEENQEMATGLGTMGLNGSRGGQGRGGEVMEANWVGPRWGGEEAEMEQRCPPSGYGTQGGVKELALHGWRPERGVQHSLSAQFWARGGRHLLAAQRDGRGEMGVATHAGE